MSEFWPEQLIEILGERRGIVFLGAGASISATTGGAKGDTNTVNEDEYSSINPICSALPKTYTPMPTWRGLLETLGDKYKNSHNCDDSLLCELKESIEHNHLTHAAEIISTVLEPSVIRAVIKREFSGNRTLNEELYEKVALIDQPVVMTTNYDQMYEKYWDKFSENFAKLEDFCVRSYLDSDIVAPLREPRSRVYLKLHGCVNLPDKIILSKSDYNFARQRHSQFFQIVSSLMLTRTIVFIGSGLDGDPDIELLLQDAAFVGSSTLPHYALMKGPVSPVKKEHLKNTANIVILEYSADAGGGHSNMLKVINELADSVTEYRNARHIP